MAPSHWLISNGTARGQGGWKGENKQGEKVDGEQQTVLFLYFFFFKKLALLIEILPLPLHSYAKLRSEGYLLP